jgi:bacterioferritin-associated ferredoxin
MRGVCELRNKTDQELRALVSQEIATLRQISAETAIATAHDVSSVTQ